MENNRSMAENTDIPDEQQMADEKDPEGAESEIRELKNFRANTGKTESGPDESIPADAGEPPDTVNILDLFLVLVKYRMLIFCAVMLITFLLVNMSFDIPNTYQSETLIMPRQKQNDFSPYSAFGGLGGMMAGRLGISVSGNLDKMELALRSRDLTFRIIKKYGLMPVLFEKKKSDKKEFSILSGDDEKTPKPKTIQDAFRLLTVNLSVSSDIRNQTVRVGYIHENPQFAKRIVEYYITELSETLREDVLREARDNQRFFDEQIGRTADPLLREKLYTLLAKEIEKETFAKAQKYYSFQVLDPPIAPELKIGPNRKKILVLSFVVSFFMATCGAFLIEFVRRARTKDAYRYKEIVEGLRPRIWRRPVAENRTDRT